VNRKARGKALLIQSMPKTSDLILTRSQLALLDVLQTPMWILDIEEMQIWWANRAALTLWNARSLEELRERDGRQILGSAAPQLQKNIPELAPGKTLSMKWTFDFQGHPVVLKCICSSVITECSQTALLVEGGSYVLATGENLGTVTIKPDSHTACWEENWLLEGVAKATNQLLTTTEEKAAIALALEALGQATVVDRVYIFQHHYHPQTGIPLASQRWEWAKPGVTQEIDNPELQNVVYDDIGMWWYETLCVGRVIASLVRDLPSPAREILQAQDIRSILVVPIQIQGNCWGFIGFDDCQQERHWTETEKSILMAAAGSIGGAIARSSAEAKLAQLNARLETIVEQRTTELKTTNDQLRQEIQAKAQMEEQLRYNAFHDSLTGLPNRALFMEELARVVAQAKDNPDYLFAVLFLDLDRFKVINDSLGHTVGDGLLIEIAYRLQNCITNGDLVARLGGDEFAILLKNIPEFPRATQVAEQIHSALSLPFILDGPEVFTSVSIGIALSSTNYDHPEDILRDAHIVMYRAKALGRSRYEVFNTAVHQQILALLQLENDLRRAVKALEETKYLPRKFQIPSQFQLHYQPIIALTTSRIVGFEALLRWDHPELGRVSPAQFIPLAEETGLIVPLGEWVLREACSQLCLWQQQFPQQRPLTMSVNLSFRQFYQSNLIEQIDLIFQETGVDRRDIKMEITESVIMDNAEFARAILSQLKFRQIQLCMDDFGTGYSSLSYLQQLEIDTLKIDHSFVSRMEASDNNWEIVKTIVDLAHNLGMDVVAEGVETREQLDKLQGFGCELGQGYLFAPALDSVNASELLAVGIQIPPAHSTH